MCMDENIHVYYECRVGSNRPPSLPHWPWPAIGGYTPFYVSEVLGGEGCNLLGKGFLGLEED